jgi:outer membrane protein TolC
VSATAVIGVSLLGLGAAQPAEPLTFAKAMTAATSRSIDAQRAALAEDQAAADLAVLEHENEAKLGVSGIWGARRPKAAAGSAARDQVYELSLSKTLYDFGRHAARIEQSKSARDVKNLAREEVTEALRYRVARAFAEIAAAERQIAVAADEVDISGAKLKQQQTNYRRGLRPESDVVTAEADVGRAQLGLIRAQDAARTARLSLARLMGVESGPVAGALPAKATALQEPSVWRGLVGRWADFAKTAAATRREREVQALSADEELISATKRPVLSGSVNAQHAASWDDGFGKPQYTGQVELSWDVPWSGMSRDELRRVAIERQDLGLQDASETRARSDQDALGRAALDASAAQWDALVKQRQLAERQLKLVQRRYESGNATATEVSTAESQLVDVRSSQAQLAASMVDAVIDVAEARGVKDVGEVFE